jgi:short-subunit dehydrogenase
MGILGPVTLAHYDDWDWGLGVLLGGVVNGIQTFLPRLIAHGEGGHIVNTASMAGVVPIPGAAIYITAKSAVIGLSEALRSELTGEGIGVSAFCPGPVQTNIREGGRMRPERYGDSGYTELEQELEERANSPLWMDPRECGGRVLAGIRRDDLYIFTHREFREGADERFRAMLASFPDEPLDDERADDIRFLLSNPIFRTVLEQRSV